MTPTHENEEECHALALCLWALARDPHTRRRMGDWGVIPVVLAAARKRAARVRSAVDARTAHAAQMAAALEACVGGMQAHLPNPNPDP